MFALYKYLMFNKPNKECCVTEFDHPATVSIEVVQDSLEHIRKEYLLRQGQGAELLLTHCYANGLELWDSHRARINTDIEEAGGIAKIKTRGAGSNMNLVKCVNGNTLSLASILKAPSLPLLLPDNSPTFDLLDTFQEASLQLSFGGLAANIHAFSTRYDLDGNDLLFKNDIEEILDGSRSPTQIGVSEVVTTHSRLDANQVASGNRYEVVGRIWGAKLRKEYAPDPHKDPEAYAAWRAEKPLPRLDIAFHATTTPVRSRFAPYEPELPFHADVATYFSHVDMTSITLEGVQKMMRFGGLLNTLWRAEFGNNMPVPTSNIFSPETKALNP
jgi:hypothetical protein